MSDSITDRARRLVRHAVQAATAPARAATHAVLRRRPDLEPQVAEQTWLWQPGWTRGSRERRYRVHHDGTHTDASPYTHARNDLVMRTLGAEHHERALEVGCGEGLLSERLVTLTDRLVAVDLAGSALERARARLAGDGRARFERRALPFELPGGTFDLIVCADALFLWDRRTLDIGLRRLLDRLRPGGRLLLVHHRGDVGQVSSGDAVHDHAIGLGSTRPGLIHLAGTTVPVPGPGDAGVRLDVIITESDVRDVPLPRGVPLAPQPSVPEPWTPDSVIPEPSIPEPSIPEPSIPEPRRAPAETRVRPS